MYRIATIGDHEYGNQCSYTEVSKEVLVAQLCCRLYHL
nr:MAG TPA: hypothetical protein [Caudoviricetes sp.]